MKITEPTISVILPVYNGGDYLSYAIESILNQTFTDFELIIINDGSTDSTYDVIKNFAIKDKRIIAINRENKGLISSLNEALDISKGKFIARMDADDIALPNRLQKQIDYLLETKLDICGCHYFEINEANNIIGLRLVPTTQEMITIALTSNVPFAHPSILMNKEFLTKNKLKYGCGTEKYAEDLNLWIQMFNSGAKFGNVDDILFRYRILPNSLSRVRQKKILIDSAKLYSLYIQKNKSAIKQALNNIHTTLNKYEQEWVCSAYISLLLRFKYLSFLWNIKKFPKKIVINSFLSEINKFFKL